MTEHAYVVGNSFKPGMDAYHGHARLLEKVGVISCMFKNRSCSTEGVRVEDRRVHMRACCFSKSLIWPERSRILNLKKVHRLKKCSCFQKLFMNSKKFPFSKFVHKFKKNRGVSNNICIQNFVPNLENVMFQNISTKIKK